MRPPTPAADASVRAVLLDALGTLVELDEPQTRLRAALRETVGADVGAEAAARGLAAEIAHYRANHLQGRDTAGLEALRDDCAAVLRDALGMPGLELATVRAAMLEALELRVFPDAAPALRGLRERGIRLVVVSDWDCSLARRLERAGLAGLLDGVVSSAVVGEAKPSPAVFRAGLELAGTGPGDALHVGDSVRRDVGGAGAAGVRAVLIARDGGAPAGIAAIRSLEQLASLL
ncbi:MAG: HAD family hydrolase [Thermoleophilaceae bacterium]